MTAPASATRAGLARLLGLVAPGATGRARHVTIRNVIAVRRNYAPLATGLVEPFFYLLSIGVGVGALVGDVVDGGVTYDYTTFVAPAMLAAAAMNGAISESTFNIFAKLRWDKLYDAVIATPLSPSDVAVGELLFAQLRGTFYSATFLAAMAILGLVPSWWGILALPAATLIGVAFSAAGLTIVTRFRTWEDFEVVLLVQMAMFLFSATFYPLDVYPRALQLLANVSPLYHGVALCRDLILGRPDLATVGHAVFLAVMAIVFLRLASKRFTTLLYDDNAENHTPR
jgi:lipooligosaccharide transport system permease protein